MFARLSTLLVVFSLLNIAFAWTPRSPTSTKPISAVDIKSRQNSREKIIQRAAAKRARAQIRTVQQEHKDVFGKRGANQPQQSPKVYPRCPGSKGLGYAHYYHWDYYSNDIPGNPRYAEQGGHNTEENCIALCSAHQLAPQKRTPTPDTSCIGVVYVNNGPCYLKGQLFKYGTFQYGDDKHSVDLVDCCEL